jgi:hypothetical protein
MGWWAVSRASLTLGRDGMGRAGAEAEADFDSWTAFVEDEIDEACGFEVAVSQRQAHDVQTDDISGADDADLETVREAVRTLWDQWCEDDGR